MWDNDAIRSLSVCRRDDHQEGRQGGKARILQPATVQTSPSTDAVTAATTNRPSGAVLQEFRI